MPLAIREWSCDACGVLHDRDVNAACNLKELASSYGVIICGEISSGKEAISCETNFREAEIQLDHI